MPIPDFQALMLPILQLAADRQEHRSRDVIEHLAAHFKLDDAERRESLPSGAQPIIDNRTNWAITYLKKAGLLDRPRRATIAITERGLDVLRSKPAAIDVRFLKQFPEFVEFHSGKSAEIASTEQIREEAAQETPEEIMEKAYQAIRNALAQEILAKVVRLSPQFFERLVVELLVKMGYGGSVRDAGKAIGKSGDEGIDGVIKEDKLGLDVIYVQAKRWQPGNVVGRPEIQKFVGALAGQGAKKGIFITTSSFTRDALEYIPRNETKIVLIDGERLAQYMIDYNLGVTPQTAYELKRIDFDYFGEE